MPALDKGRPKRRVEQISPDEYWLAEIIDIRIKRKEVKIGFGFSFSLSMCLRPIIYLSITPGVCIASLVPPGRGHIHCHRS